VPAHAPLIAVTGATGVVGGRVAARLADRGIPLRLVVRDPARAPALRGADVRRASGYGDRAGMRAALEGADTLFLVPAEEAPDRIEQHRTAVDAALEAGVRRIVYLSFLGAGPHCTFLLGRDHSATEEHIRAAGVPWTFARMSLYTDFLPRMVLPEGVIAGPAGDGRVAPVTRADVADVAVALLLDEHAEGQVHDVTGPRAYTLAEVAAELSRLAGKPIVYRDETLAEARASRAGYGAPEWMVEAWISTYTAIAAGELAAVTDAVERLTGHAPTSLAEYVRAHPESLEHVRA
jgi:NAD(P)H dehydrogenase (quinone)